MNILCMRHGDAEYPSGFGSDAARSLTDWGKIQAEKMGAMLQRTGYIPDMIVCSSYLRARETAVIVANAATATCIPEPSSQLIPSVGNDELWSVILENRKAENLLLVGHMPSMGSFAGYLIAQNCSLDMSTASVAAIRLDRLHDGAKGSLLWYCSPTML